MMIARSLKELEVVDVTIDQTASGIIPGDWGKVESGWLVQPLVEPLLEERFGGRIHQLLWRRSRAVSNAKSGAARAGTMRNRSDSSQVTQESFEPEGIAVTQRVIGCYCASARGA